MSGSAGAKLSNRSKLSLFLLIVYVDPEGIIELLVLLRKMSPRVDSVIFIDLLNGEIGSR